MTTDTLVELAGIILKKNCSQFLDKTFKQKRSTLRGTKFAPPYSILVYIVNIDTFSPIATDEGFKINKDHLNSNSKKVVCLSECKKCKNPYIDKSQSKFRMRLNIYKSAYKSFKTKKRGTQKLFHGHYVYRMIMKVTTIGNLR